MPQCEDAVESTLKARTYTGTNAQVICQIGTLTDVKHYVWVKNLLNFPTDISSYSRIRSEPRVIRFKLGDVEVSQLSEDHWSAVSILDTDEERTIYVDLLSDRGDGTPQDIEVELTVSRWHDGYMYSSEILSITVLS